MRFLIAWVPEVYQLFWAAMARGEFITDAAVFPLIESIEIETFGS